VKISAATAVVTPVGTDEFPVNQGGASKRMTLDQVKTYAAPAAASDTVAGVAEIATQAEQETGTDTTRIVSPGRQHFHPGHPKFWACATVSAGVPTLATSYNVTSITDTAAGQLTVTIATDFSSANWCCQVAVERAATSLAVTNIASCSVRLGGMAAGTVLVECWDDTATNHLAEDPAKWFVAGFGDHT
jgi:hypothetical protein